MNAKPIADPDAQRHPGSPVIAEHPTAAETPAGPVPLSATATPARSEPSRSPAAGTPTLTWPVALPFLRIALVIVAALVTSGTLLAAGQPHGPAAVASFSALYLLPVNLLSLWLVRRLVHREGLTLRGMIGFDRSRLGRDILWGLLWIAVLYLSFAGAIVGTMFALFGADAFESFDAVFAPDPSEFPAIGIAASVVIAILIVLTFAPINAPTEELVYRGYAQGMIAKHAGPGRALASVLIPSLAFGLQHIFFASTVPGMVVYGVAFFVWGLGSALIYRRQGRLMPLIVAHFLVNLLTSLPALILPFVLG